MGVRLLTIDHISSGSVFKIFKNDTRPMAYPPEFQQTAPGSGQINWSEHVELLKPLLNNKNVMYKIPDYPKPLVADEEKKVEKRHSETRKIELGE